MIEECYENDSKLISIPAQKSSGYRSKMTFNFSDLHHNTINSNLGHTSINNLCQLLYEYAFHHQSQLPNNDQFWIEIMVQMSRMKQYMIKIIINPLHLPHLEIFQSKEMIQHLLTFINLHFNDSQKIHLILYQICPNSKHTQKYIHYISINP